MKIIVTGASGLLGSRLVKILKKKNFEHYSLGFKNENIISCDLTKINKFKKLYSQIKPDIIVNLACLSDVDRCESNLKEAISLNSIIPKNISQISGNDKLKVIHISTDHLYNARGMNKENNIKLINNYAFTKFLGEKYILKNKNSIILRTNFFGKSISYKESFSDWILKNYKNKSFRAFNDVYFNPVSISTLCEVIIKLFTSKLGGTFNIGSETVISKYEFSKLLLQAHKIEHKLKKINLESANLKSKRPKFMGMNSELFHKTFRYKKFNLNKEIAREI